MIKTQADALRAELATLKRQHEQLRAAAEAVYPGCEEAEIPGYKTLRAALDATPAEPVRETPTRHTYTLHCNGYADCTADQRARGCPECTRVRVSE